jgi:hypothetical protein
VVSVTDPYGRILGFLDWRLYFFFQTQYFSENLVALGIEPDHWICSQEL